MKNYLILALLTGLFACQKNENQSDSKELLIEEIPTPVMEGGAPNLFVSGKGQIILSWIEYLNDTTDALLFSRLEKGRWSAPNKIANGSDWFVNWADFPSLAAFEKKPNSIAAHWLQKSANGTYDYDVRIALSRNGGQDWAPSFIPHRDGVAAEHGFVTLLPLQNGRMFAVWLDGRNTKNSEGHNDSHAHGGAMTLRTAEFDEDGNLFEESELDAKVCDCCQTDAVLTDSGPVVIYRDRSDEEVRDISIVRKIDGEWTAPQKVYEDNWEIAGCPVNGPAIAVQNNTIAIAWFSAAEDESQVNVIFSKDAGKTFFDPIRIDDGDPIGRVDIVFASTDMVLASWMEQVEEGGEIRLAKVRVDEKMGESLIATKAGVSRKSGFPILERVKDDFLIAWTVVDSVSTVKTAKISLDQ